jgi:hypothetical protein
MNHFEKRRHERINTIIRADLFTFSQYDPRFVGKGVITDIGIGGMKLETNDVIEEGEDLLIKFFLPRGQYFDNIRGRIVRTQKDSFTFIYGIRFIDIKFLDKIKIWLFTKRVKIYKLK